MQKQGYHETVVVKLAKYRQQRSRCIDSCVLREIIRSWDNGGSRNPALFAPTTFFVRIDKTNYDSFEEIAARLHQEGRNGVRLT